MNTAELKYILIGRSINPYLYSLDGTLPDEGYCIFENNGLWEVCYAERGKKYILKTLTTEHDACEFMLEEIISDPTTRLSS